MAQDEQPKVILPNYEDEVAYFRSVIDLSCFVREYMTENGYARSFAEEVAKTLLWRSLNLESSE